VWCPVNKGHTVPSSIHPRATTSVLELAGEIDLAVAQGVRQSGLRSLNSAQCTRLVIDLSQVTFMDATGIGVLVALRNAAAKTEQEVVLRSPSGRLQYLLEALGLRELLVGAVTE
jgi:anti-sigma B factor antagonist